MSQDCYASDANWDDPVNSQCVPGETNFNNCTQTLILTAHESRRAYDHPRSYELVGQMQCQHAVLMYL